ncbi:MAG: hypothetical protein QXH27_02875 [Candidatus Micrarchaeia archaeon]
MNYRLAALALLLSLPATALADAVEVYFFYGSGCPHCASERIFLEELRGRYPLAVREFEVWYDVGNARTLENFSKAYGVPLGGVPVTFIGEKYWVGFDEETIGKDIEAAVAECARKSCVSPAEVVGREASVSAARGRYVARVPFFGEVELTKLSLPALALTLGLLDGFNPCAMWVLTYLIALLLGQRDRRRMWLVVGTFVLASGVWYYLFLSAWLSVFLFLGYLAIARLAVGGIALVAGGFQLREFITLPEAVCRVTDPIGRSKLVKRAKELAAGGATPATLLGVIVLAFTVNSVELVCSAGFPATYTGILALSNLSLLEHQAYILLYDFFYMLDDMIIFSVAVVTLSSVELSKKYARASQLVGGLLMLLLGVLLIFKPEALMFG